MKGGLKSSELIWKRNNRKRKREGKSIVYGNNLRLQIKIEV